MIMFTTIAVMVGFMILGAIAIDLSNKKIK